PLASFGPPGPLARRSHVRTMRSSTTSRRLPCPQCDRTPGCTAIPPSASPCTGGRERGRGAVDLVHDFGHVHASLDFGVVRRRGGRVIDPIEDRASEPISAFSADDAPFAPSEAQRFEVEEAAAEVADFGAAIGAEERGADDAIRTCVGVPAHGEMDDGAALELELGDGEVVDRTPLQRLAVTICAPPGGADARRVEDPEPQGELVPT